MDRRVREIIRIIESNDLFFAERNPIHALAKLVALSDSWLRHIFKAETGTSPAKFVKSEKMRRAAELLKSPDLTVKEVRGEVGLTDPSHFTRDFKRYFAMSPTSYRSEFLAQMFQKKVESSPAKTATRKPFWPTNSRNGQQTAKSAKIFQLPSDRTQSYRENSGRSFQKKRAGGSR